jgi:hypothetical protein
MPTSHSPDRRAAHRGLFYSVVVLLVLAVQYLVISNAGVGWEIWVSDTWSYGNRHSWLPLPWPVRKVLHPLVGVISFPLSWIFRTNGVTPRPLWVHKLAGILMPFGGSPAGDKANSLVLAVANTAIWCLAGFLALVVYRRCRTLLVRSRSRI